MTEQTAIDEAREIVRASFNPSHNAAVTTFKDRSVKYMAAIIVARRIAQTRGDGKTVRLYSLAMTAAEESAMWAVKAATSDVKKDD